MNDKKTEKETREVVDYPCQDEVEIYTFNKEKVDSWEEVVEECPICSEGTRRRIVREQYSRVIKPCMKCRGKMKEYLLVSGGDDNNEYQVYKHTKINEDEADFRIDSCPGCGADIQRLYHVVRNSSPSQDVILRTSEIRCGLCGSIVYGYFHQINIEEPPDDYEYEYDEEDEPEDWSYLGDEDQVANMNEIMNYEPPDANPPKQRISPKWPKNW